jgi:methylated-DNA-[protein]-cysteine S-methyltransferase
MKLFNDSFKDETFGLIVIGVTEKGLRYLNFGKNATAEDAFEYARKYSLESIKDISKTANIINQVKEYFQGNRKTFKAKFDIEYLTAFTQKVLLAAFCVPFGSTSTYGNLAKAAGSPAAFRAVGQVMANNPIPIIIPCHRILNSQGKLGGFRMGLDVKVKLLQLEGAITQQNYQF